MQRIGATALLAALVAAAVSPITLTVDRRAFLLFPESLEFLALDMSQPFTTDNVEFERLAPLPKNVVAASVLLGEVSVFAGACGSMLQTYTFSSGVWVKVFTNGQVKAREDSVAFSARGRTFIFGGQCKETGGSMLYNTLDAFSDRQWSRPGNKNPPVAEYGFAAATLDDSITVITGGIGPNAWVGMTQVAAYDALGDAWNFVSTTGNGGDSRTGHSSVVLQNNSILVFGGHVVSPDKAAEPQLLMLDTSKTPYKWSSPWEDEPIKLSGHAAIMLPGNIMLLYGGQDLRNSKPNAKILLFDANSAALTPSYDPPVGVFGNAPLSNGLSRGQKAAISVVFLLMGLAILASLAYMVHRKRGALGLRRRSSLNPSLPSIHPPTPPPMALRRGASVKEWVETIARHASGMPSSIMWDNDENEADMDDKRMVQVVFSAPRGKLRVVNPDPEGDMDEEPRRRVFSFEKKEQKDLYVPKHNTKHFADEYDDGSDPYLQSYPRDLHKPMKFI